MSHKTASIFFSQYVMDSVGILLHVLVTEGWIINHQYSIRPWTAGGLQSHTALAFQVL